MTPDGAFELIAGHPALDLVNTLDWRFRSSGPEELLATYDDVLRFALQSQLLSPRQARGIARNASGHTEAAALIACREMREAAAEIFYAAVESRTPAASAMRSMQRFIARARERQKLVFAAPCVRWEFAAVENPVELPLWVLTLRTAGLMVSDEITRLRACESDECRWLFLDTSKNHSRRWCDMKFCGNRMKARRFKAQHRA